jgi:hypothetical protein
VLAQFAWVDLKASAVPPPSIKPAVYRLAAALRLRGIYRGRARLDLSRRAVSEVDEKRVEFVCLMTDWGRDVHV